MKNLEFLTFVIMALLLTSCGGVPEETPETTVSDKTISVNDVFKMIAEENDVTRTLYTKAIVGEGTKQGFKYDEDWEDDNVEAGPLPALFLRGISADIRKSETPLGLYLGSDFPVNNANKFTGQQAQLFEEIKANQKPQYFYDADQELYTAMFADLAVAPPCISCHNDHPQTTKTDWKLGDVMGATTWQYPADSLSVKEALDVIAVYRNGTKAVYNAYLKEIENFKESEKPEIGEKWPSAGKFLPTAEVFVDSVSKLVSHKSMKLFIQ